MSRLRTTLCTRDAGTVYNVYKVDRPVDRSGEFVKSTKPPTVKRVPEPYYGPNVGGIDLQKAKNFQNGIRWFERGENIRLGRFRGGDRVDVLELNLAKLGTGGPRRKNCNVRRDTGRPTYRHELRAAVEKREADIAARRKAKTDVGRSA